MSTSLFLVYLIRNQLNGKVYVGQTTQPLRRRFQSHIDNAKRGNVDNAVLGAAILKYGRENFAIELLESCASLEDLNRAEIDWIEHFNSRVPNGYNIREGGGNAPVAESTKIKLRNRIISDETRQKMAAASRSRSRSLTARTLIALAFGRGLPKNLHGERNPNAKLTLAQVEEIRRLYATGEFSQQELADLFEVKQVTISAVIRRKNWNK